MFSDAEHRIRDRLMHVARLASMGELVSGIAHEINQPLAAITAYARACERYLAMDNPDLEEMREAVREISAEGLRAGSIVQKLRQMVRTDSPGDGQPRDVNEVIEEIRSLLDADARVHGVELRIDLAPELPVVRVNAVQLQQVVLNLARNAFEALAEDASAAKHVQISTRRAAEGVEIVVTDDGPGISPAIADRLFDPFASTKGTGTGLGLAMSRTIIKAHGGTIAVRAGEPRGSTFSVWLPPNEET